MLMHRKSFDFTIMENMIFVDANCLGGALGLPSEDSLDGTYPYWHQLSLSGVADG